MWWATFPSAGSTQLTCGPCPVPTLTRCSYLVSRCPCKYRRPLLTSALLQNKPRRACSRRHFVPHLHLRLLRRYCSLHSSIWSQQCTSLPCSLSIVTIVFAVKHKSPMFAVTYLIFMGFLFIVEIGSLSPTLCRFVLPQLAFCRRFSRHYPVTHLQSLPPFLSPLPKTTSPPSNPRLPTRPKA